jgi:hypothetical protein
MSDRDTKPEDLLRALDRPGASPEDRMLAQGLASLYPDAPPPPAREEGWATIAGSARRHASRRWRRYLLRELLESLRPRLMGALALGTAAGLAILLVSQIRRAREPRPMLLSAAQEALPAAAEPQAVQLLDGTVLQIAPRTAGLRINQADQRRPRVQLATGTVQVKVPRSPSRKLVVATSDVEVIVHGTRFDVRKLEPDATQVAVYDGLVEVRPVGGKRAPAFLRPGESLIVPSAARYHAQLARQVGELITATRCDDPDRIVSAYLESAPPAEDVSAALYLQGYCAAQQGNAAAALGLFEQVAERARDVTRADNALARVAQLRAAQDRAAGRDAWERYLRRFPDGLHRDLARRALHQDHDHDRGGPGGR